MHKFSIILPVRNGGHYVKECVASVQAQTYQDFNFIVLDNNSTDGTREWIASLNDPRIIIHPSPVSLSIEENWARVISIGKNEFITIIGHDDILNPDYLTVMDDLIKSFPDAGLYQTHFNFIDGKGDVIRTCVPMKQLVKPVDFFEAVLRNTMEIIGTGFMVRSKDYDAHGGIPAYPNLLYADIEIWMKIIQDNYLAISPKNCFSFRFHIENTSKSSGMFRLIAFERMVDFFKQLIYDHPEYAETMNQFGKEYLNNYVTGSCHKLIYIPKHSRNAVSMDTIITTAKRSAQLLIPDIDFNPSTFSAVRVAKTIDSTPLLRGLFLFYKSFSKRTF